MHKQADLTRETSRLETPIDLFTEGSLAMIPFELCKIGVTPRKMHCRGCDASLSTLL